MNSYMFTRYFLKLSFSWIPSWQSLHSSSFFFIIRERSQVIDVGFRNSCTKAWNISWALSEHKRIMALNYDESFITTAARLLTPDELDGFFLHIKRLQKLISFTFTKVYISAKKNQCWSWMNDRDLKPLVMRRLSVKVMITSRTLESSLYTLAHDYDRIVWCREREWESHLISSY